MNKSPLLMRLLIVTVLVSCTIWYCDSRPLAAADGLGSALNQTLRGVGKASQAVGAASTTAVPSGAVVLLRQVDRSLDKLDRMMSDEGAKFDKDYRSKEAAASLAEAKSNLELVEKRHGTKMGKDHAELVARRDRIAAAVPRLESFQASMAAGMAKDREAQTARAQSEAQTEAARQAKSSEEQAQRQQQAVQATQEGPGQGKILFSKLPIDPANPQNLANQFRAGDTIYGLIRMDKSWRDVYKAGNKSELGLMIVMMIGENQTYQYITLKQKELLDTKHLVLDIAPAPDKMTAYRSPDIQFGEGKGNRKIGPIAFTYELAQLPAGKHKVQFFLREYGEKPASGDLEIEGADFKFYADLHEKVKAASETSVTLPPAGMVNKSLENDMRKLLENAGWKNIRRVVIVDKDWWLEEGRSRYLNVAAAAKDDSGQFYWHNLQFTQMKLITGAWGPLELTKTGIRRTISEANIGK